MTRSSHPARAGDRAAAAAWGRGDRVLFALAVLTLVLIAVQFALPVEPLLGDTGQHIPALGALHAVNGLAIFALTGWLTGETARRRAASREQGRSAVPAPAERAERR